MNFTKKQISYLKNISGRELFNLRKKFPDKFPAMCQKWLELHPNLYGEAKEMFK